MSQEAVDISYADLSFLLGPLCAYGQIGWNAEVDQLNSALSGAKAENLMHEVKGLFLYKHGIHHDSSPRRLPGTANEASRCHKCVQVSLLPDRKQRHVCHPLIVPSQS